MKINRALGLGLAILILQWTAANVWRSFEGLLVTTFGTTTSIVAATGQGVSLTPLVPALPIIP